MTEQQLIDYEATYGEPPEEIAEIRAERDANIVYSYRGKIYNRPLGRGITLADGADKGLCMEDVIPDGWYQIEITVRSIDPVESGQVPT